MRNIIIGTAGHIDHGKTALVKALTGIDTDRLKEEKRRGISIELGFAHLDLTPELHVAFVDVPGHEKFVRSMVAGVTGIDLVMFIVAANESIKPQTLEHFEICRLLGLRHGIVVLTKSDLADPDIRDVVQIEIEDLVAGSFLEGAPIVPVSAITGAGLDRLRAVLVNAAATVPGRDATLHHTRLPVDRSFSMKGHGQVITGTLFEGAVNLREELELYPTGKRIRVRGLQVHSNAVERAEAGERTAVNLGGIEVPEASRGMVLGPPGTFVTTHQVDCQVDLLSSAQPLRHRAAVHFHSGTAEVTAQVRVISSGDQVEPGTRGCVRFVLAEPLLLLPGDRFIIRRLSPVVTIGGGVVVDIATPSRMRRVNLLAHVEKLASANAIGRVAYLVESSAAGMSVTSLVSRTGLLPNHIRKIARTEPLICLLETHDWIVSRAWSAKKVKDLEDALVQFHRRNPLQPGMPMEQLRHDVLAGAPQFMLQELVAQSPEMLCEKELVRLSSHRVASTPADRQELDRIETEFRNVGLATVNEVLSRFGIQPDRSRRLVELLLRDRKLIRLNDELVLHEAALNDFRQMLVSRAGERFSVADFKNWTGLSRKYAIPLLEFFDRERILHREGDARVISLPTARPAQ